MFTQNVLLNIAVKVTCLDAHRNQHFSSTQILCFLRSLQSGFYFEVNSEIEIEVSCYI